jgi:plasmid stabilization system protein ParE
MRTVRLLSPANRELEQAILYYEAQRVGLGREFADEFDRAVSVILENPMRWPQSSRHTHRYRMHRFAYAIHYFVEPAEVVIAVIAHPRRNPTSFGDRLG